MDKGNSCHSRHSSHSYRSRHGNGGANAYDHDTSRTACGSASCGLSEPDCRQPQPLIPHRPVRPPTAQPNLRVTTMQNQSRPQSQTHTKAFALMLLLRRLPSPWRVSGKLTIAAIGWQYSQIRRSSRAAPDQVKEEIRYWFVVDGAAG